MAEPLVLRTIFYGLQVNFNVEGRGSVQHSIEQIVSQQRKQTFKIPYKQISWKVTLCIADLTSVLILKVHNRIWDLISMSCTLPKKTDIKLNTLKCSYNRLLMTIDRPLLHGGATNACAGTTIYMSPS